MEVRFFKKSERQLLLDSIDRLWKHNHVYVRQPEVLEHLVLNTPYRADFAGEDNYSFLGMWHDNDVVGLLGVIPQEVNVFGKTKQSATYTVWITDRNRKERFNGLELHNCLDNKNISMKLCIGISEVAAKMYRFLRWDSIDELPRWVAVNNLTLARKVLLPSTTAPELLPQIVPVSINSDLRVDFDDVDGLRWDDFYYCKFAPISIGTCRNFKFLKWRYLKSPILKYHFVTVSDKAGRYQGLAVLRIEPICNGQYRIGRILEFIAINAEASLRLAEAVVNFDKDVIMWDFYCLSDITVYGLERIGFQKVPVWMDKVIMPTRFQPIDYENMKLNGAIYLQADLTRKINPMSSYQWYITKGDADQDRAN